MIKNEGGRVATWLYIDFSDIQGQITPQSMVGSDRNARMKKIRAKMKGLQWPQIFTYYNNNEKL